MKKLETGKYIFRKFIFLMKIRCLIYDFNIRLSNLNSCKWLVSAENAPNTWTRIGCQAFHHKFLSPTCLSPTKSVCKYFLNRVCLQWWNKNDTSHCPYNIFCRSFNYVHQVYTTDWIFSLLIINFTHAFRFLGPYLRQYVYFGELFFWSDYLVGFG